MASQYIGRYRILRETGRGAAAVVYQARDPSSDRQVAIKLFTLSVSARPDFAARCQQVFNGLMAFDHPGVVPVLDYGWFDDRCYLVLRYLPGGTLASRLDGRPMLLSAVVPIVQRVAEAFDAAHSAGLVHGDLNPAHIAFDLQGRAHLADLGLANLLRPAEEGAPWDGIVDPVYMSPEQAAGEAIDGRSDVYSLGVVLFEMLTGRPPFRAAPGEAASLADQHQSAPVPALSAALLRYLVLPDEFNQFVARALAKRREARYPTAGVLAEAARTLFLTAPAAPGSEEEPPAPAEPPDTGAAPAPSAAPPLAPPLAAGALAAPEPDAGPAEVPAEVAAAAAPVGTEAAPADAATMAAPAAAALAQADEAESAAPEPQPIEVLGEPPPPPRRRWWWPGLGWAGIGLIVVAGLFGLWRWPGLRGLFVPPTATATVTSLPTATPLAATTAAPLATSTLTVAPTNTASATATAPASPTRAPTRTRAPTVTSTLTATPVPPTLTPRPALPLPADTASPLPPASATPEPTQPPPPPATQPAGPPPPPTSTPLPIGTVEGG